MRELPEMKVDLPTKLVLKASRLLFSLGSMNKPSGGNLFNFLVCFDAKPEMKISFH